VWRIDFYDDPGGYEQEIRIRPTNNGIPQNDRNIHIVGSCVQDQGVTFLTGSQQTCIISDNHLNSGATIIDDDHWKIELDHAVGTVSTDGAVIIESVDLQGTCSFIQTTTTLRRSFVHRLLQYSIPEIMS